MDVHVCQLALCYGFVSIQERPLRFSHATFDGTNPSAFTRNCRWHQLAISKRETACVFSSRGPSVGDEVGSSQTLSGAPRPLQDEALSPERRVMRWRTKEECISRVDESESDAELWPGSVALAVSSLSFAQSLRVGHPTQQQQPQSSASLDLAQHSTAQQPHPTASLHTAALSTTSPAVRLSTLAAINQVVVIAPPLTDRRLVRFAA